MREGLPGAYPRLWRYCLALTGARDAAEDLAQTTVARALDKADGFTPGTHLDRWLIRMAQRLWLNELRAQKIRTGGGIAPVEELDLADVAPDAETNIFARQVFQKVMTLPEAQRATVLLVYVEGFSYKDAAAMLDIPIGTVMSRLAAARKTVSQTMADAPATRKGGRK